MTLLELKQFLSENQKLYGAISISINSSDKYHSIYNSIFQFTNQFINLSIKDRIYIILNDIQTWPICKCGCGNPINKIQNLYLPHHGNSSHEVKQKKKQNLLLKYNVENPSQLAEVKQKKKDTYQKNYNANHYLQSNIGKINYKKSLQQNYSVENNFQRDDVKNKIKNYWNSHSIEKQNIQFQKDKQFHIANYNRIINRLSLYNIKPLFTLNDYYGVDRKYLYKFQCDNCYNIFMDHLDDGNIPRCEICSPKLVDRGISNLQIHLQQWFQKHHIFYKSNCRNIIYPNEIDIYLPNYNIGIELDGIYWHSDLNNKNENYHFNKTNSCKEKNIQLIHIFENELVFKPQIVYSYLKHLLHLNKYQIDINKCVIQLIDIKSKNKFLQKYHIHDTDNSDISIGAFFKKHLIAVMSFTKNKHNYCLSRFAQISNFDIPNIKTKLLDYFQNYYHPKEIITKIDLRWNNENLYKELGFQIKEISKPNCFYFQKNNCLNFINENNLDTHKEYHKIWDCGNIIMFKNY